MGLYRLINKCRNTPSGAWKPIATTEKGALLRDGGESVHGATAGAKARNRKNEACAQIEASPAIDIEALFEAPEEAPR